MLKMTETGNNTDFRFPKVDCRSFGVRTFGGLDLALDFQSESQLETFNLFHHHHEFVLSFLSIFWFFELFSTHQNIILGFRMHELQTLLTYANCKKSGNKKADLQRVALQLVSTKANAIRDKVQEIYESG